MPSSPFSEDERGRIYCRACTFIMWGSPEAFKDNAVDTIISISAIHIAEQQTKKKI